jgi:citrate lyase subunit beta/citryl-CoA lyase
MRLRSLLFVPGDSPQKIQKAIHSVADCVIIDLEDAVAHASKDIARTEARAVLSATRSRPIAIRINGQQTSAYHADLLAMIPVAPDYVMLPKCHGLVQLLRLEHEISLLEAASRLEPGRVKVLPIVTESAAAISGLDYRNAPVRTAGLCFGAEDLAADLGVDPRDSLGSLTSTLEYARIKTVIAACAAGLPAIDTPFPDHRRADILTEEATQANAAGFSGKLCIHPNQIECVNRAFSLSAERSQWADAVIEAFAAARETGVATVAGQMVDQAHLKLAKRLRAWAMSERNN